jgi:hypothetical protein
VVFGQIVIYCDTLGVRPDLEDHAVNENGGLPPRTLTRQAIELALGAVA